MEVVEIDLLDLCKRLLKKWKLIVVVAIVFGLVGNVYGVINKKNDQAKLQQIKEEYNLDEYYYTDSVIEKIKSVVPSAGYDDSSIKNVEEAIAETKIYNSIIGEVTEQMLNNSDGNEIDGITLSNYLEAANQNVKDIQSELSTSEKSVFTEINNVIDYHETHSEEEFVNHYKSSGVSILQTKYALIGAFLGVFIVCGIYCCFYVFNGKIKTDNELSTSFKLIDLLSEENIKKIISKNKYKNIKVFGENLDTIKSCDIEKAEVAIIAVKIDSTKYKEVIEYINQTKLYNIKLLGYLTK